MNPFLSIIVPIYNVEKYLRQCVDSILQQDFKDYELWLIDDGSKDASIDIIKEYAAHDTRIKTAFIHGDGPAVPRNYGLRRAVGEYILFIDSDDYLPENALSTLVDKAKEYPQADFIRGNQRILVNETREARSVFAEARRKYVNKCYWGGVMVKVLDKDYAPIDSLIKRKFLIDNNIFFHEELVILEDGPFIIEIMAKTDNCLYIDEETYVYRLGNVDSVTNSKKTFPKCCSLARGAWYNAQLMTLFEGVAHEHIRKRSVEHAISAVFQAAAWLSYKESKAVLNQVHDLWPKMPNIGHSSKHNGFIRLYNISPMLALLAVRLLRKMFR